MDSLHRGDKTSPNSLHMSGYYLLENTIARLMKIRGRERAERKRTESHIPIPHFLSTCSSITHLKLKKQMIPKNKILSDGIRNERMEERVQGKKSSGARLSEENFKVAISVTHGMNYRKHLYFRYIAD